MPYACHEGIQDSEGILKIIRIDGIRWDEWSASCYGRFAPPPQQKAPSMY